MSERANRSAHTDTQHLVAAPRHVADAGTGVPLLEEKAKIYSKLEDTRFPDTTDGCFVAGTLVWTDKGQIPIEQIKVGDMVLSQPEAGGELAYKRVKETFVFDDKEIWRVEIFADIERETITKFDLLVTTNHPLWVKGIGWTSVDKLNVGDYLLYQDGSEGCVFKVDRLFQTRYPGVGHLDDRDAGIDYFVDLRGGGAVWDYGHGPFELTDSLRDNIFTWRVYNFEVEDFHTYYVGEYGLWVHNTHCAGHQSTTTTPAIYEVSLRDSTRGEVVQVDVPHLLDAEVTALFPNPRAGGCSPRTYQAPPRVMGGADSKTPLRWKINKKTSREPS